MDTKIFLKKVKGEIADIITELNQTTERNVSIIEFKINALNKLVNDADSRIKLLDKKIKDDKVKELSTSKLSYSSRLPNSLASAQAKEIVKSIKIEETPQIEPEVAKVEDLPLFKEAKEQKSEKVAENLDKLSLKDKVLNMANNGYSSKQISSALKISSGEVDLILSISTQKISN
ncbi:MAG: hypothetical protein JXR63_08065 [Spirochaetales bacterium]|nr:hypothetical protein [Spirochaetales bacterium]